MSMLRDEQESKIIEDSIIMTKTKAYSKPEKNLKQNYGSVDYTNFKAEKSLSNYTSNQMLNKKTSHQVLTNNRDNESSPLIQDSKQKKALKKNMSEEKHLKVNLDVNVNINLKFNKKSHFNTK